MAGQYTHQFSLGVEESSSRASGRDDYGDRKLVIIADLLNRAEVRYREGEASGMGDQL